jgi:SAM-dependent methyltransferase
MYEANTDRYANYLRWLYGTFDVDPVEFRRNLVSPLRISTGQTVLVTGCGFGDDIPPLLEAGAKVEAQDLSAAMVDLARKNFPQIKFWQGDAGSLPYAEGNFDAAFHFGGINEFQDRGKAIREMARVVKDGGRVCFGDESVAPWLRSTDYGKMAICNNALWAHTVPLDLLPFSATDVSLRWILGNCFYQITFTVKRSGPKMNPDIPHIGKRGGSMRTRYYGQLEGVTEEAKTIAIEAAAKDGVSIHEWLERVIRKNS